MSRLEHINVKTYFFNTKVGRVAHFFCYFWMSFLSCKKLRFLFEKVNSSTRDYYVKT